MNTFALLSTPLIHSDGTMVSLPTPQKRPTVDMITSYLSSLSASENSGAISPCTRVTYTQGIKTFVKTVGINAPITTETYATFLRSLQNLSESSVRTYKAAVLDYYQYCKLEFGVEIDWVALHEVTRRYTQKSKRTLVQFDEQAVDHFVEYALSLSGSLLNLRNRAMIVTFVDTGFRNFELRELTIGDLDWATGTVIIRGKGDKQAKVRFSDRALDCIRDYLEARYENDSAYPDRSLLPIFARHDKSSSRRTESIGGGGVWAAIKLVCQNSGDDPDKIWVHVLRHKFVTTVYRSTGDVKKAQELARHSNMETTLRYTHLTNNELDETYEKIFNSSI